MFRKRVGDYYLGRTLGEGTYAKVKYGRHAETGEEVAIKIMRKDRVLGPSTLTTTEQQQQQQQRRDGSGGDDTAGSGPCSSSSSRSRLTREIAILRRLRHPNLVQLRDVLASKDKVYVVMEFVAGGELFDLVAAEGPLPENEARKLFQQLADALAHCHAAGIFHRDLKPENVLLTRGGDAKLSDFGFGHFSSSSSSSSIVGGRGQNGESNNGDNRNKDHFMLSTACGTPAFVAPEVLSRKGYEGGPADVWSLGVTLAVMLSGRLPFDEPSLPRLFRKIAAAEFSLPPWVPRGGADLVRAILRPEPRERPTLEQIFEHPWVKPGLRRATTMTMDSSSSNLRSSSTSNASSSTASSTGGIGGSLRGGGFFGRALRKKKSGGGDDHEDDGNGSNVNNIPLSPRSAAASVASASTTIVDPFSDSVPRVAERNLDAAEAAEASVRGGGGAGNAAAATNKKMNAFTLLSAALDLSGLLDEREGCVRRHTRFTTRASLSQVHACLARAAESVGGRALSVSAAALAAAAAAAAKGGTQRPLPASAWRARLDLPVVSPSSPASSFQQQQRQRTLFVSARVDISPLLPGMLVVDVARAGGAAAADFYGAYGPFEAAVLEELSAAVRRERDEREKEASRATAAVSLGNSGASTPDPRGGAEDSGEDAAAAASLDDAAAVVGARKRGSLLASAASLGEQRSSSVAGSGVPRNSSLRSLRCAGSGGGAGGGAGANDLPWDDDDDGSSGDDFDAFDNDHHDDFGGAMAGAEGEEDEGEVVAIERLIL